MITKLALPPLDDRSRELWIQHAAGFIIFRDMKDYAVNNIPTDTTAIIYPTIVISATNLEA